MSAKEDLHFCLGRVNGLRRGPLLLKAIRSLERTQKTFFQTGNNRLQSLGEGKEPCASPPLKPGFGRGAAKQSPPSPPLTEGKQLESTGPSAQEQGDSRESSGVCRAPPAGLLRTDMLARERKEPQGSRRPSHMRGSRSSENRPCFRQLERKGLAVHRALRESSEGSCISAK